MDQNRKMELWACLALSHVQGLGPRTYRRLLDFYGTPFRAVKDASNWVSRRLARRGLAEALCNDTWRPGAEKEWRAIQTLQPDILLWTDSDYPERLRELPDPPLYLYMQGDRRLLSAPIVAMVGSRSCSEAGVDVAYRMAADLSRSGVTVISGFAHGIDRHAHRGAMRNPGRSIGVLGTGLDSVYPATNRDLWSTMKNDGLLLTEFPPGTKPEAHNFPRRNRIISGLSLGVIVVEAAIKSGSLITAELAMEQNREVFAVPGPVSDARHAGCHALIRQGAVLVRNAEDILKELAPQLETWSIPRPVAEGRDAAKPGRAAPSDLSPDQAQLVAVISSEGKAHMDRLTRLLQWESSRVSQVLAILEIQGVVRQLSGMYYTLESR